jgi:hypothetical protein
VQRRCFFLLHKIPVERWCSYFVSGCKDSSRIGFHTTFMRRLLSHVSACSRLVKVEWKQNLDVLPETPLKVLHTSTKYRVPSVQNDVQYGEFGSNCMLKVEFVKFLMIWLRSFCAFFVQRSSLFFLRIPLLDPVKEYEGSETPKSELYNATWCRNITFWLWHNDLRHYLMTPLTDVVETLSVAGVKVKRYRCRPIFANTVFE